MKKNKDEKVYVMAFSGGESSFYALKLLLEKHYHEARIIVCFCNTGLEDEDTLRFVDYTEKYFQNLGYEINIVWLEYSGHLDYRIVSYKTAYRCLDEMFEDGYLDCPMTYFVDEYQQPEFLHRTCTRELKLRTINRYLNQLYLEGKKTKRVVGIRFDEIGKRKLNLKDNYYILIKHGITKSFINNFMLTLGDNRLSIPSYCGNCGMCTSKELRKLIWIAKNKPSYLNWWKWNNKRLGVSYPYWSNFTTVEDLIELTKKDIKEPIDERFNLDVQLNFIDVMENDYSIDLMLDKKGDCSDSCEPFEA